MQIRRKWILAGNVLYRLHILSAVHSVILVSWCTVLAENQSDCPTAGQNGQHSTKKMG